MGRLSSRSVPKGGVSTPDLLSLAAAVFICFMVPIKLGKNVLTGSYTNFSKIALAFLKYFLLDVQTTFKLMTCMNCIREESQKHHLFPRKFCGHCSLENSKSVTRIIEIWENLRKYFEWLQ